jgi:hypothetical protein
MCHCLLTTLRVSKCTPVLVRQKGKTNNTPAIPVQHRRGKKPASLLQLTEISNKQYCPYISYQRISHIKNNKKNAS